MGDAMRSQIKRLEDKLVLIAGERELEAHRASMEELLRVGKRTAASVGRGSSGAAHSIPGLLGSMSNEQIAHELLLDPNFRIYREGNLKVL